MAKWFACKFKYNIEDQYGGFRPVTETYLIDAVSFTEAEKKVYEEVGANYRDFVLEKVDKFKVTEIVETVGLDENKPIHWYKVKVAVITLDEKSGKEKKSNQIILVSHHDIKQAYEAIEDLFSDSTSDHAITDINLTPIVELIHHIENIDKENTSFPDWLNMSNVIAKSEGFEGNIDIDTAQNYYEEGLTPSEAVELYLRE